MFAMLEIILSQRNTLNRLNAYVQGAKARHEGERKLVEYKRAIDNFKPTAND